MATAPPQLFGELGNGRRPGPRKAPHRVLDRPIGLARIGEAAREEGVEQGEASVGRVGFAESPAEIVGLGADQVAQRRDAVRDLGERRADRSGEAAERQEDVDARLDAEVARGRGAVGDAAGKGLAGPDDDAAAVGADNLERLAQCIDEDAGGGRELAPGGSTISQRSTPSSCARTAWRLSICEA